MRLCCTSESPRKTDSAWSWLVCLVASFSNALTLGMGQCFAVVMPVFMELFKESKSKTALVGSIALGLIFGAMPLSAIIIRRINYRIAGLLGLSMGCISLVITSFIQSLLVSFFSYSILYGLGTSLLFTSNIVVLTHYFDKRHSAAIGMMSAGQNVGGVVLGPLIQILIDLYDVRWMYRIIAAIFLIAIFLLAITYDTNVQSAHRQSNDNEDQGFSCAAIIAIFKTPAYVIAVTTLLLEAFSAFVSYVHLVSYCIEVNIEVQKASRLFVAIGVSAAISCIISGRVLDIKTVNPFHVTQIGGLSMGLSLVLVQFASTYTHFIIFSVFLGLGIGTFLTTIVVLLMQTVDVKVSLVALTLGQMISSLGNAFGSPFVGFIADVRGSYRPAFFAAGVVMLVAFLIPFLQYCFKPWRKRTLTRSLSNIGKELALSDEEKKNTTKKGLEDGTRIDTKDGQIESHINPACADFDETNEKDRSSVIINHYGNANNQVRTGASLNVGESSIELHSHTNIAFELVEKDGITEDNSITVAEHGTEEHNSGDSVAISEECETHL